jgi:hypothetical protein
MAVATHNQGGDAINRLAESDGEIARFALYDLTRLGS